MGIEKQDKQLLGSLAPRSRRKRRQRSAARPKSEFCWTADVTWKPQTEQTQAEAGTSCTYDTEGLPGEAEASLPAPVAAAAAGTPDPDNVLQTKHNDHHKLLQERHMRTRGERKKERKNLQRYNKLRW